MVKYKNKNIKIKTNKQKISNNNIYTGHAWLFWTPGCRQHLKFWDLNSHILEISRWSFVLLTKTIK